MVAKSKNNERIKEIKKMKGEKGLLFLDSPKLILEAIDAGYKVKTLIINEEKEDKIDKRLLDIDCEKIVVWGMFFKTLTTTVSSQGVIAIIESKKQELEMPKGNFLVLDEVQDPGNVGTLIRSGLGSGFLDVYMLSCAKPTNDKVLKSSMGAVFRARLFETTREEFIEFYNKNCKDIPLYSAELEGKNIFETSFEKPCGLVIGNEGNGVSKAISTLAKNKISIPMKNGLESLNAGVAGGIIMFQIANKT